MDLWRAAASALRTLLPLLLAAGRSRCDSPQLRLYQHVMANYSRAVHPKFDGGAVNIWLSPTLERILHVNEVSEVVEYMQWWEVHWTDDHFNWEPDDFDGQRYLYIHMQDIWVPDVTAYEIISCQRHVAREEQKVRCAHNGNIMMTVAETCTITCPMRMDHFPFDKHECRIRYLAWQLPVSVAYTDAYGQFEKSREADEHQEWEVSGLRSEAKTEDYGTASWRIVYYHFTLTRRPDYYILVLVLPTAIVSGLVLLAIFSPAESTLVRIEKVNTGLTGLLAYSVLLVTLTGAMPKTSKGLPLMGDYMLYEICLCALATFVSTLLMYMQILGTMGYTVPRWLACCCCVNVTDSCCGAKSRSGVAPVRRRAQSEANDGRPDNNIAITVSHVNERDARDLSEASAACDRVRRIVSRIGGTVRDDPESDVDGWTVICFRLDLVLLVLFQVANLLLTLSYTSKPAKNAAGDYYDDYYYDD